MANKLGSKSRSDPGSLEAEVCIYCGGFFCCVGFFGLGFFLGGGAFHRRRLSKVFWFLKI